MNELEPIKAVIHMQDTFIKLLVKLGKSFVSRV